MRIITKSYLSHLQNNELELFVEVPENIRQEEITFLSDDFFIKLNVKENRIAFNHEDYKWYLSPIGFECLSSELWECYSKNINGEFTDILSFLEYFDIKYDTIVENTAQYYKNKYPI